MRRRGLAALLLLSTAAILGASTSFSAVAGMGHMSDFAFGNITSFPISARLQQGASDMGWFDGVDTTVMMDISLGLAERRLIQDPGTGAYLEDSQMDDAQYDYYSFYSQISYVFRNAFFDNHRTDKRLLTVDAAINVRFEQAFDSFPNIRAGRSFLDGYLNPSTAADGDYPIRYWDGEQYFTAAPDIAGDAYMLSNSISVSATLDNMYQERNKIYREGLMGTATLSLAPWWLFNDMDSLFDTRSDWYKLDADVTWAKVLYNKEDWKRWNRFSLVIEDRLYTQLLLGSDVPKFADTVSFPGIGYTNIPFTIQNQLRLYAYGPNFLSDNTIPYGYVFANAGLATGVPNNSNGAGWENFLYLELGLNVHLEVLGALHVFAEVSYTFSNMTSYGNFFDWDLGCYVSF